MPRSRYHHRYASSNLSRLLQLLLPLSHLPTFPPSSHTLAYPMPHAPSPIHHIYQPTYTNPTHQQANQHPPSPCA
jgi:hypothetical protein